MDRAACVQRIATAFRQARFPDALELIAAHDVDLDEVDEVRSACRLSACEVDTVRVVHRHNPRS